MKTYAEFFAGAGMVSEAMAGWSCVFANDIDEKKAQSYLRNQPHSAVFHRLDIRNVTADLMVAAPNMVWGSFPCQDLSVAGKGQGLSGGRSGLFYEFWRVIDEVIASGAAPELIVVENVVGSLTSREGRDFTAICRAYVQRGYRFAPMIVDARAFLPQSRARLFVVGIRADLDVAHMFGGQGGVAQDRRIAAAVAKLPKDVRGLLTALDLPVPRVQNPAIEDIIDAAPRDVAWHSKAETAKIIAMMSEVNLQKLAVAKAAKGRKIGFVYKRTRPDGAGSKTQRAEVRFDGIAGCLRTPGGGSSRQIVVEINGGRVRTRLLGVREAARLMGLRESYVLPERYNEGYHLIGDGVAVPVVAYLREHVFDPILQRAAAVVAAE